MNDPRTIRISDYDYPLPDERIAKFPLERRDQSKLLIYNNGVVSSDTFYRLPDFLPTGALMVFNNTRVIQARLHFRKGANASERLNNGVPTLGSVGSLGALIEIFLLEPYSPRDYEQMFQTRGHCSWLCIVGNLKKWKEGSLERVFTIGDTQYVIAATRREPIGTSHRIDFEWYPLENRKEPCITEAKEESRAEPCITEAKEENRVEPCPTVAKIETEATFADILDALGELPIPPYLNRASQESDKRTYQTVYSKIKGSVAAPTAGLHFTPEVLSAIDEKGIDREELTLHVGAGTFRPVKSEQIEGHDMHTEHFAVRRRTLEKLLAHHCQTIAVGTTSVRTLESLYWIGLRLQSNPECGEEQLHVSQWEPYDQGTNAREQLDTEQAIKNIIDWMDRNVTDVLHGSTQIIIVPGYEFKIVKMLVTNFHQPKSTLLLLVSAFVKGDWRRIYDYALQNDFRFLSYGDSSLLM